MKKVDGTNEDAPTNIVGTLKNIVDKVNLGLAYKADIKDNDATNEYTTQYLEVSLI